MSQWKQLRSFSKHFAVIGLGFGDEGKGSTVNFLSKNKNPVVIRHNGGHQAGHTVTLDDGTSHTFSNFGSGSFQNARTYWSKYCTFDPVGIQREYAILSKKNCNPTIYVDKNAPITTPFEKNYNRNFSDAMKHGTCGVGVNATYKRELANCSFLFGDLEFPEVVEMKLASIMQYYVEKHGMNMITPEQLYDFQYACEFVRKSKFIMTTNEYRPNINDEIVFEGAQGLLLDQNIGFFPHVTPSNTGTKNILEMVQEPWCFLVTRAYQTRHGNGPMTNEKLDNKFIKDNPKETNISNTFQGNFRKTMLDLDLLKYAMGRDNYIHKTQRRTLVVTCLDQMKSYHYTVGGKVVSHIDQASFLKGISNYLKVPNVWASASPQGNFEEFEFVP